MTGTELVALTLLHFLWQGALIHGALIIVLQLARPRTASVRYVIGIAGLALMAAAPIVTASQLAARSATAASSVTTPFLANDPAQPSDQSSVRLDPSAAPTRAPFAAPLRDALASVSPLADRLPRLMPWLVATWLTGVILLASRLLGGWLQLRALVIGGRPVDSQTYDDLLPRLRRRLRIRHPIRVLESAFVHAPAVIGWLRPALLIPASLSSGLTVAQLETILAHELAHIRRHDYAVNLLQSVIETVLFYHPSVWYVSKRIREEREHCCDDLAVAMSGDARLYASALLELETQRLAGASLALAATGGSLLRRIRRLLTPNSLEGAEGSRWFAGIFVLAAVVLVGTGARLLRADPSRVTERPEPNEIARIGAKEPPVDETTAPPDTVIVYRGSEPLAARSRWARETAEQHGFQRYWIGYVIEGNIDRGWIYFDRHVPVRAPGGTTMYGHFRMKEAGGLIFSGARLDSLVPARAPSDIAILLGFVVSNGRAVLDRVHAGNFVFPVHLDSRALLWLGEAADEPSIALAQELFATATTRELREDIAGIVGVHTNSDLVRPVLSRWLQSADDDDFRAEVVEWLGFHADSRTLGLLARTARDDRSSRVRAEAAETVGEVELPAALDTLIAMTETLRDHNARREAVEAFGHRSEPRALEALKRITERDESTDIQREAVETLGEIETERALALVTELAYSHKKAEIRREAVETLGERAPLDDLMRIVRRIVEEDRSIDVQREAVETLAERDGQRVLEMLAELAERHPEPDVQREATESLGHASPAEQARRVLERLARTHAREDVRREAIEALAESVTSDSAARFFESLMRGDESSQIKISALEALSEMKNEAGLNAILDAARAHPDRAVRKRAIELLGESRDPRARALLERILTRP